MNRRTAVGLAAVIATFTAASCAPPPAPEPEPGEWISDGQCFASATGGPDITYLGPEGELGNFAFHPESYDGTCTGTQIPINNAVLRAPTRADAAARCSTIVGVEVAEQDVLALAALHTGMPDDAWGCLNPNA